MAVLNRYEPDDKNYIQEGFFSTLKKNVPIVGNDSKYGFVFYR